MRLYLDVLGTLRRSLFPLIVYEALFKVASVAVLAPLSALVLALFLETTGTPALSNFEIAAFLLTPTGALALVTLGALSFSFLLLEQAGIVLLVAVPAQGQRPSFLGALLRTLAAFPRLVALALLQFVGYLAALVPFALLAVVTYKLLLAGRDINYYLAARPTEFWVAVVLGALLLVAYVIVAATLFVRWLFALPLAVLRGQSARSSLRDSARLTRGRFWSLLLQLAVWFLLMLALAAAGSLLLTEVNEYFLGLAGDETRRVLGTVALLLALHAAAGAAWSFVLFTGTCLLVMHLYWRATDNAGLAPLSAGPVFEPPGTHGRRRSLRLAVWLGTVAFAALTVTSALAVVESVSMPDRVQITAHRGAEKEAPENTLSAIRAAIDAGADYAEIDVQETADGVVVLLHDKDLGRVGGISKGLWELKYEELKDFDVGAWFKPAYRGERIPTLEQVIDAAGDRIRLNIELKYNGHDHDLANRVVDVINRKQFAARCVVTSMNYQALLEVKQIDPNLKVGLIVAKALGDLQQFEVDFYSLGADLVNRDLVGALHLAGKAVHVWTLKDRAGMQTMIEMGVDNIITNDPALLRDVLAERSTLSNVERILLSFRQRLLEG